MSIPSERSDCAETAADAPAIPFTLLVGPFVATATCWWLSSFINGFEPIKGCHWATQSPDIRFQALEKIEQFQRLDGTLVYVVWILTCLIVTVMLVKISEYRPDPLPFFALIIVLIVGLAPVPFVNGFGLALQTSLCTI